MRFIHTIRKPIGAILLLSCLCLSGCWDLVEINQLAIVNLLGLDQNPDDGKLVVYYQVINPAGIAAPKGAPIKAPVYSYPFEGASIAEFEEKTSDIIPRQLFPDHYQGIIVTERMARNGLLRVFNFSEKQFNRRSNVNVLITASPLPEIMNTYVPLERLPGRSLRSLIEIQSRNSSRVSKKTQLKDLIERAESTSLSLLPIIRFVGSKPSSITGRYEHIQGKNGNIELEGGALFLKDRMIGKLPFSQVTLFLLVRGEAKTFGKTVVVNNSTVDVRVTNDRIRKRLTVESGRPVLKIDIKAFLSLVTNNQKVKLTTDNLNQIKRQFNELIEEEIGEFYAEGQRKGWDLLDIGEQIRLKRGKKWEPLKQDKTAWNKAKVEVTVRSKIWNLGSTIDPYKGG